MKIQTNSFFFYVFIIIINVTTGTRFFTIALTQLAFDYDLKMFYLDAHKNIVWLKD